MLEPTNNNIKRSILKAYQKSLYNKRDTDLYHSSVHLDCIEPISIEKILFQINNFRQLPQFLEYLKRDENISEELRCQLNNVLDKLQENKQKPTIAPQESNKLQSYLLILIAAVDNT
ncbi:hypothetical protein LC613_37175 [Nostoc sphaeroides CHAB 2801]|uniref:hypothetical protein n=1 Tax=Nostoc sphaeroides TaxID=446679 RepID=UPI001E658577|nr:hypothetical protein [Nostoc sphaeroides]MCC5633145.1 hypothetical protein [Nostoc sphaeroides CHAB 2801]